MKLRPAGADDAKALAAVHAQAFDAPWTPDDLLELLAGPGVYAVAAVDDEMAGFILMRAVAGQAEIITLAVAPAHRRLGAARALVEAGLGLAAQSGAEDAFLEVAADNAAAIALYEGAGFSAVGCRKGYYRRANAPAADALVLRRTLNEAGRP